jgi:hypothetical protein
MAAYISIRVRCIESGLKERFAVLVPLLGNGARQQFSQITALNRSSFNDDVIDFIHKVVLY